MVSMEYSALDFISDANVGFFVRNMDEYLWLKALLSKSQLVKMMAKEYQNNRIDRVEFPGILAVHFVCFSDATGSVKKLHPDSLLL